MSELIIPPDVVDVVCAELNAGLPLLPAFSAVRATGRVPDARPRLFVRVRAVGGTQDNVVHVSPTVVVEAYAEFDSDAAALGNTCHAIMLRAGRNLVMGGAPCSGVSAFSMPQDLPDPTTDQARYTATYAVTLRGVAS